MKYDYLLWHSGEGDYIVYIQKRDEHIKGPCIDNLKFMYGKTIYYKKE